MPDLQTLLSQFLADLYAGTVGWPGGTDLVETTPGTITLTNPSASNTIRVTNGSNLEYGQIGWASNFLNIGTVINGGTGRNTRITATGGSLVVAFGGDAYILTNTGITKVANLTTVGLGVPAIVAAGRVTAQSAAVASISTFTVGAADGTFEVSANMNVTAAVTLATTLTVSYTDESNTARVMVFPVNNLTGTLVAAGAITGTGPWSTTVQHLRCKAATAITIGTTVGTFTTVTYTAEGLIRQLTLT